MTDLEPEILRLLDNAHERSRKQYNLAAYASIFEHGYRQALTDLADSLGLRDPDRRKSPANVAPSPQETLVRFIGRMGVVARNHSEVAIMEDRALAILEFGVPEEAFNEDDDPHYLAEIRIAVERLRPWADDAGPGGPWREAGGFVPDEQGGEEDLPLTQRWRFHRHFANNEIHRDGGPECTQPSTPRRMFVFDLEDLWEHDDLVRAMNEDEYAQYKEEGRSL